MYPFIDTHSGGMVDGLIVAREKVLSIVDPKTTIIHGHGPPSNPEELKTFLRTLRNVRDRIRKLLDEGKTAEDLVLAKPTSNLDPTWGKGFMTPDAWVTIAATSLARK